MKEYNKEYVVSNPTLMANIENLKDIIVFKTISGLIEWTTDCIDDKTIHKTNKVEIQISKEATTLILNDGGDTTSFVGIDITKLLNAIDFTSKQKEMESLINFVSNFKQNF
jgi:hypothetical protein